MCTLFLTLALWDNHSSLQYTTNHSSLPAPLLQYQVYLRDVYHKYSYSKYSKPSDFLAVNRPDRPIPLVLIHKEKQIDTSHNEQVNFVFRGKVDEIQKQKTPIKIEEIGSTSRGNGTAAHFVLIEGAPGVGKSTLCWQLCRLWSEGKLQQEWDLVVLVELRDESTRKATSVYDLLYHPDNKSREAIAQEIQKREGEGLMMIFDGYDELSNDQQSEFSLVQQILSNRVLEKATIVVTSRPNATRSLPNKFRQRQTLHQHIVIVGFNETDIQTYITLACKDNIQMLESLHSYLSSRPFILSVMYNPLHCTIVAELYIQYWLSGETKLTPNTLTELYTALVLHLLRRSLPLNQSSDIEELTDLPTHVYNNLIQLAELAATGLETLPSQYVYKKVPCDTLGLMVSVRQLYDVRPKKRAYMFLHLTLQEYLSALYWSHQSLQQQIEFLHRINFEFIMNQYWYSLHWPQLLFYAGLTKLSSFPIMTKKLYITRSDIVPLCQILFEIQSPQYVSDLFNQMEIDPLLRDTFDWFVIGFCIANSNNKSSWNVDDLDTPQQLQFLLHGLHYNSKNNINLNGLTINMSVILNEASPMEYSKLFSGLYPFTKAISHLSLVKYSDETYPDDECCFHVLQNLSFYCPNLKSLFLSSIEYGGSFVSKNSLDIPKDTMVTIALMLPHVLFDSLHQYKSLSEIYLVNSDR